MSFLTVDGGILFYASKGARGSGQCYCKATLKGHSNQERVLVTEKGQTSYACSRRIGRRTGQL